MRKLRSDFMKEPDLIKVVDIVKKDDTLLFCIRENNINVYYRGVSILKFEDGKGIDKSHYDKVCIAHSSLSISNVNEWIDNIGTLKNLVDTKINKSQTEKEFQQLVVRTNTSSKLALESDYYFVDIESIDPDMKECRFDIVGFKWANRKNINKCKLSIVEMKYGKDALDNMNKHFSDILYLDGHSHLDSLKEQTLIQFRQLRELGLINLSSGADKNADDIKELDDKAECIILFADLNPKSELTYRIYKEAIKTQSKLKNIEIKFAVSSFMGYALFNQFVLNLDQFKDFCIGLKITNF
ncbi:hypothetical protein A966_07424 [Brachyspira hampsonii 30446]|uniref:Uncharacterized protein n=1 Tax=Brachyspira hampsonii 30446 TaxID=1289135 RepID=A0A2U4F6U4_9SPIR|nr:hypothetical protein [Brachyspira hampsonii]EKV56850.1 hypothetical protein A966_07424 [Brachyspira hampsonii 30446]MBW5394824.1 hypothetical protein [Brachyspira hampsonii]OEJ20087.1 hypothetical protein A9495_12915 [Brachyspira hampsonii]